MYVVDVVYSLDCVMVVLRTQDLLMRDQPELHHSLGLLSLS